MRYRAAIFDIDGTLLPVGKKKVPYKTVRAVNALKKKGVKVIIATGRGPVRADKRVIGGIKPDYTVCANGACILDEKRHPFFVDSYEKENLDEILGVCGKIDIEPRFIYLDGYYIFRDGIRKKLVYKEYDSKKIVFEHASYTERDNPLRDENEKPFAAFVISDNPEVEDSFNSLCPNHRMVPYCRDGFDIVKAEVDKVHCIEMVLCELGIPWEQAVAFGDGRNDIKMLMRAGLGVAMENSVDEVKAAADIVAPDCAEYGVCTAIKELFAE